LELYADLPSDWTVGWIGTKDEAMAHPEGGDLDLRDYPLSDLIQEIRAARLVIGPSSGPMHLASLCGTPHLVWSGNVRDIPRYRTLWNPFHVSHTMLATWQPDVGAVLDSVLALSEPLGSS
jgi:ADP-heptose:LPS heptosyltransferase